MLALSDTCKRGWGLTEPLSLTSTRILLGWRVQWGARCFGQGTGPLCLLYLIRHNCAAALAQGEPGWGICKSRSQLSYGAAVQVFIPVLPAPASRSPHWRWEAARERHERHIPAVWRDTRPQTYLLCVSSAVASLLFSLSLCSLEASSCKMIPVHSQQLVIMHWTFGGERGCSGPTSTWRKRPLLSQEARLRDMELPCLRQDSSPASTCPGC